VKRRHEAPARLSVAVAIKRTAEGIEQSRGTDRELHRRFEYERLAGHESDGVVGRVVARETTGQKLETCRQGPLVMDLFPR
jgi:hypothetical protein